MRLIFNMFRSLLREFRSGCPARSGRCWLVVSALLVIPWTAFATDVEALVAATRLRGGIVFMPQVAGVEAPLALARRNNFLVYTQTEEADVAARLAEQAAQPIGKCSGA